MYLLLTLINMEYSELVNASKGASLWLPWESEDESECLYFTFTHVDLDNQIIKTALAKTLQRSGEASSLGYAFKAIDSDKTIAYHRYVGHLGEDTLVLCDKTGETPYDGHIDEDEPRPITLVEVDIYGD